MTDKVQNTTISGAAYAICAYGFWGFVPIYWKLIAAIPAWESMALRGVWSLVFLMILVIIKNQWQDIQDVFRSKQTLLVLVLTSGLVSFNWFLYIWAIQAEKLVEASLGYYINPLLNVLLGVIFLNERLNKLQIAAVSLAIIGVLNQAIVVGEFPWIALSLASTFSLYGLLRKRVSVESLPGLTVEVMLIFPLALGFLLYLQLRGIAVFLHADSLTNWLAPLMGAVTAAPLLWVVNAAKRLRYSTLGFFQYIAPTINFLLAVWVYHEPFGGQQLVTFICIWSALLIYLGNSILSLKK